MQSAAMVTAIFTLALFATYCYVVGISLIQGIDALHVYPMILILVMFAIFWCPFDILWRSSRKYVAHCRLDTAQ
jgi:hypothetical protein